MGFGDMKKWAGNKMGVPSGGPPHPPPFPPKRPPMPGAPSAMGVPPLMMGHPSPPPGVSTAGGAPPLFNPALNSQTLPPEQAQWATATKAPERPDNPPSWVTDEDAWEKAKAAVKKNWGDYDEPWAVVSHVYQNMTGG